MKEGGLSAPFLLVVFRKLQAFALHFQRLCSGPLSSSCDKSVSALIGIKLFLVFLVQLRRIDVSKQLSGLVFVLSQACIGLSIQVRTRF